VASSLSSKAIPGARFCEAPLTIPKLYFRKVRELEFLQQFPSKLPGAQGRTPATAVQLQKSSVPGEFPRAKSKSKFTTPAQLPQAAGFPCAERSRPKKKGAAGQTGTDLGKNPFRPFPQQLLLPRCQIQPLTGVRTRTVNVPGLPMEDCRLKKGIPCDAGAPLLDSLLQSAICNLP
jgi:hypothetical protein